MGLRDQLIALKQQGHTLADIAGQLGLPLGTVDMVGKNRTVKLLNCTLNNLA